MNVKEVEEMAMVADMAEAEKLAEFAPSGSFKKDSVNRLIRSLNEMLKHFAVPAIAEVDEDIDGPMPEDVTRALFMIDAAVEDAKMDEYSYNIGDIRTDRDIMMLRGKIEAAAKDRAFVAFLRKPMPEGETDVSVSVSVEEEVPEGSHRMPDGRIMKDSEEHTEEDLEQLMAARMA
jgi:hypothetical protein|tara:strand:- start:2130 stop:2657 length:528 start_codon:yes stop_codon:yes gene_type:complete